MTAADEIDIQKAEIRHQYNHYEEKYWDFFNCKEIECAKHWDGYTEKDVGRLMSLPNTAEWIYAVDKCWLFATFTCKNIVKCSKCGNTLDMNGVNAGRGDANFCPNCGKKMNDNGRSKTVPKGEEG